MHRLYPRLHEKYGKLVRVGPSEVSVADLDAIQTIYGMAAFHLKLFVKALTLQRVGAGNRFAKSDWYSESTRPLNNTDMQFC